MTDRLLTTEARELFEQVWRDRPSIGTLRLGEAEALEIAQALGIRMSCAIYGRLEDVRTSTGCRRPEISE